MVDRSTEPDAPGLAVLTPHGPRQPAGRTPAGVQSRRELAVRRAVMACLVLGGCAALAAWMFALLSHGGMSVLDWLLFAAFLVGLPWTMLGFWNAVIGLVLLHATRDPLAHAAPFAAAGDRPVPLAERTAVLMTLRNEDPARAFARLRIVKDSLETTGQGSHFDFFVLSDTNRPEVAAAEEALFRAWQGSVRDPHRLHYRRRTDNAAFKAGNVRDFLERFGAPYTFMLPLDADSLMTGPAILRLQRIMEAHPRIGILQSLVVGLPSQSLFARLFQFGMRHGMRSYTMGSAWWQGECGPYWGHNALIRVAPFRDHCHLPVLPGKPPLGGHVLSHDQIEAVLMRRAGYEVRVLPSEGGSYEDNPPALPDFTKRDLRWCQGNMQYFRLLTLPGLLAVSRLQVLLAIWMYLGAFAWMLFVVLGALKAFEREAAAEPFPFAWGVGLFCVSFLLTVTPKLAGVLDALLSGEARARYGGAPRLIASALAEFLFMTLITPAVSFGVTLFMLGLPFGRAVVWEAQNRDGHRVGWGQAARWLWPQALFGAAVAGILAWQAPGALPWASPMIAGLLLAVPLTVLSAEPALGRLAARRRICAIPEEFDTPNEVRRLAEPEEPAARVAAA